MIIQFHTPKGIVGVDSETVTDAELATLGVAREAFNDLLYPTPALAPPDPDTLRAQEILTHSPNAITMPEMWELMRIFGRRLGYRF